MGILDKIIIWMAKQRRWCAERQNIGLLYSYSTYQQLLYRYHFASKFCKGRILEVGCGEGYGLSYFSQKGEALGGDYSRPALEKAGNVVGKSKLVGLDAQKLPFKAEVFDTVIALELIEHLRDPLNFLEEVKRCLKDDGIFVLSAPIEDRRYAMFSPYHVTIFTPKELDMLLLRGFEFQTYALPGDKIPKFPIAFAMYIVDFLADFLLKDMTKYNKFRRIYYFAKRTKAVTFSGITDKHLDPSFFPQKLSDSLLSHAEPKDLLLIIVAKKKVR